MAKPKRSYARSCLASPRAAQRGVDGAALHTTKWCRLFVEAHGRSVSAPPLSPACAKWPRYPAAKGFELDCAELIPK